MEGHKLTNVTSLGRQYRRGKTVSEELGQLLVSDILRNGGNKLTGDIPRGVLTLVAKKYKFSRYGVHNIWKRYVKNNACAVVAKETTYTGKLSQNDIAYLESLKTDEPSISYKEMKQQLTQFSATNVSLMTICRAVKHKFSHGPWTFKRVTRVAEQRFTLENLQYTQAYLDSLHDIDPWRLKFMDESGFRVTTVANPNYGHAFLGQRAVQVRRYDPTPNMTLNLLAGLQGVAHVQTLDGASNSMHFADFIRQCVETVDEYGVRALQPGDFLVVDNAPIHHSDIARELNLWLNMQGIEVIFTPKYSPEFNPVEFCFNKIKRTLERPPLSELAYRNLSVAIYSAVEEVSPADVHGFFSATGYLFV
ncbi:uncharacterized protein LOC144437051 [Glandiceps talaboti]